MILHEGVRKERRTMTETRKKSPSRSLANSSGIHAEIDAGVCGFKTTVEADPDGPRSIHLTIESDCAQIQKAAPSLTEIDMLEESKAGVGRGRVYYELAQCVKHVTCPVASAHLRPLDRSRASRIVPVRSRRGPVLPRPCFLPACLSRLGRERPSVSERNHSQLSGVCCVAHPGPLPL